MYLSQNLPMKKSKINDGHYLEVLDRIHVMASMIEEHLSNHPLVKKEDQINKLIKFTLSNLSEAYQIAGELLYEREKPKNKTLLGRCKKSKDKGMDCRKKLR